MEERRDRRQYDAQISRMDSKIDKTDLTLKKMGDVGRRMETRVMKLERALYMLIAVIIITNICWALPNFQGTIL